MHERSYGDQNELVYTFFDDGGPIRLTETELCNEYMRLRGVCNEQGVRDSYLQDVRPEATAGNVASQSPSPQIEIIRTALESAMCGDWGKERALTTLEGLLLAIDETLGEIEKTLDEGQWFDGEPPLLAYQAIDYLRSWIIAEATPKPFRRRDDQRQA